MQLVWVAGGKGEVLKIMLAWWAIKRWGQEHKQSLGLAGWIALAAGIWGLAFMNQDKWATKPGKPEPMFRNEEYRGHRYVVLRASGVFVHDPDCCKVSETK